MFEKKLKILLILSLFFLNQGCGYQPLLTEQYQKFNVKNFNISGTSGEKVFSKNFSQSSTYKASKLHLDTLNREKKIVDNIVKKLAEEITNNLNLIYN